MNALNTAHDCGFFVGNHPRGPDTEDLLVNDFT